MKICAIHQPNFFPWMGYFEKIKQADVFVFLDQVDYPKSGKSMGSWCNRVKFNIGGQGKWVACPVIREKGRQIVNTVQINNSRPWRDDMMNMIKVNYKKAPNFEVVNALVERLLLIKTDNLADFNIEVITTISQLLRNETEIVRQSQLPNFGKKSTERLVEICKHFGADTYLSGSGAEGYQEEHLFEENEIKLAHRGFSAIPYGDPDMFIPGLSVIDFLMFNSF